MSTQQNPSHLLKFSRLNSVGRRSSISQYEPKETFKLAAIRSINKGVKYNDLSFITGNPLNKLRVEQGQSEDLQYATTHDNLSLMRKRHDDIRRNRMKKEQDFEALKQGELQKLQEQEKQYNSKKTNAKNMVKNLESEIVNKKIDLETVSFEHKSMVNMTHRIKHDKVVYDLRKFQLEKQLGYLKKRLAIVQREEHVVGECSDRTKKVLDKLARQLEAEQREREEHLRNLSNEIQLRQDMKDVTSAREGQVLEIAQRAMQDKDENEKNWKKLLNVHKFVGIMLRQKMQRQMSKFHIVEVAFKNIKIATGVADTIELVNKFLNKQSVYGQLLSNIAESQKKIETLKNQHDILQKQRRSLEDELNLFETTKKGTEDLTKQFKALEFQEEKGKKSELQGEKLYEWVLKQLRKIYKAEKAKFKMSKYSRDKIKEAMEEVLNYLEKNCEKESFDELININQVNMDNLKRIKEDEEETDEPETGNDEEDYVATARSQLIKQNDKFMKELKKKAQNVARLKMEMLPKKKDEPVVVAKPKQPQE